MRPKGTDRFYLRPIGIIRSTIKERSQAPRQGSEGAPDAWLEVKGRAAAGLKGVKVGHELLVITWFHQGRRNVLQVRPPPVTVREIVGRRMRIGPIEAIDGTPVAIRFPSDCGPDGANHQTISLVSPYTGSITTLSKTRRISQS